ncbi:hypothetical protein Acsp03_14270 [Actinomadura sp. NBRC 104412]|uniref:DUF397 domain-containing protein n=1 Tax=unclassified Actinomadura TaxID=2626254 RepID=UPI0024A056C2|nr:DUF397 domain-containing protein [Actinomadura sp. NBRC 104412]GLZ03961.1 hypothetical protein Acsp03_14270 [Actinomadura sp. NBRC 104412]
MRKFDSTRARWRKSSRSGQNGNCVEVARVDELVAVRDSKNPDGGRLDVGVQRFAALVVRIKRDELSL